jgi:hypothetical protein
MYNMTVPPSLWSVMAPLSNACVRRLLLSSCSLVSSARSSLFCSAKAPYAAPEEPACVGLIEGGAKLCAKLLEGRTVSLGWEIPSALPRPEVPSSFFSSLWKNRPLGYHLQPGCGVVKAAGLHEGAGHLVRSGAAAAEQKLATDEILKEPEVKPVQNAGYAGPQSKTCIKCEHSKGEGDFETVKSSKDNRSDTCRACLAALRGRRSGRELNHLQLTLEEAWKKAKICQTCNERKEARDFYTESRRKDGLSSVCRGCKARRNEKRPTRIAVDIPQRCKCCKEVKLACEFYPDKKARNGIQQKCKGCSILEVARYRKQYSSEYVQRQTKLCTGCGITKQRSEFYVERASIDGLYCYCRECDQARKREKRTTEVHNLLYKSSTLLGDGISPHE